MNSDVSESLFSSQSQKPFESESIHGHLKFFRVNSEPSHDVVESEELLSYFDSSVCKLESMSSQI